jgi:hypothetical protein
VIRVKPVAAAAFALTCATGVFAQEITAPDTLEGGARAFKCDGTDPFFFEELNNAGRLGYGETWDEHICDEGAEVYGEGATSRWKAFKPRPRARATDEEQALALVLPLVSIGGLFAVGLAAAALAFAQRLRRQPVLTAGCPACDAELPVSLESGRTQHMFCPMCGAPCTVDIEGKGKTATARAHA